MFVVNQIFSYLAYASLPDLLLTVLNKGKKIITNLCSAADNFTQHYRWSLSARNDWHYYCNGVIELYHITNHTNVNNIKTPNTIKHQLQKKRKYIPLLM